MDKSWQTQKYNETTILAMWFIKEFWDFLKVRKKYWLIPIFIVLILFGALIIDGKIIAAAQEERFSRKKHDSSYPFYAIEYVLREAKLKLSELSYITFYEKPFLKFERLLETYVAFAPKGFKSFSMSMPIWLREKLFQKKILFNEL